MNLHLKQFALHCLHLAVATAMPVFFIAFLAIPYSLGGHPEAIGPDACHGCSTAAASAPAVHQDA